MSAPAVIDSFEFARAGEELSGSVEVRRLQRLEDLLSDSEGVLSYVLKGSRDARKRPQLRVEVSGRLHVQCQRCLGRLDYDVDVENTLLLIERGAPHDPELDEPESPDAIEGSDELDVLGLVEEEILLSLPIAPRHENECVSGLGDAARAAGRPSPFALLETLKGSRSRN